MLTLLTREFVVEAPLHAAWNFLSEVERWPLWARHIRSIRLAPPGALTAASSGKIRLTNGVSSTFRVVEFLPGKSWMWVGKFLWLTVEYDHRFEALDSGRTRLTWTVSGEGAGLGSIGRLFAAIYARNLDRAIPRLIAELNASGRH